MVLTSRSALCSFIAVITALTVVDVGSARPGEANTHTGAAASDEDLSQLVVDYRRQNYEGRASFLKALALREDAVALSRRLIASEDEETIELGCRLTEALGPTAASLARNLGDALIRVRKAGETNAVVSSAVVDALVALGKSGEVEGLALASQRKGEGEFEGFQVLQNLGPRVTIAKPYLLELLGEGSDADYSYSKAQSAVETLATMGEIVLSDLCRVISRGNKSYLRGSKQRLAVSRALFTIQRTKYVQPQSTQCLSGAVQSSDPTLNRYAVGAAGALKGDGAVEILTQALLKDHNSDVRDAAAHALSEFGDRALAVLQQGILSDNADVRDSAWFALSWLDKTSAKQGLLRKLEAATSPATRVQATLMAAEQFTLDDQGLANLLIAIHIGREDDRRRTLDALAQAPPDHPVVAQALTAALSDSNDDVRAKAYELIAKTKYHSADVSRPLFTSIEAAPESHRDEVVKAVSLFVSDNPAEVSQILLHGQIKSKFLVVQAAATRRARSEFVTELLPLAAGEGTTT